MSFSIVNSKNSTATTVTSITPTYLNPPTVGNILVAAVGVNKGAATLVTASTTTTGWSLTYTNNGANGSTSGALFLFTKTAVGSDANLVITLSSSCTPEVLMEEINCTTGQATVGTTDVGVTDTTVSPTSLTGNQVTATQSGQFAYTAMGGRTGATSPSFSGGSTLSNSAAGSNAGIMTGSATMGGVGSTLTPVANFTSGITTPFRIITTLFINPPVLAGKGGFLLFM